MTGVIEGGWEFVTAVYALTWTTLLVYTIWVGKRLAQVESIAPDGEPS